MQQAPFFPSPFEEAVVLTADGVGEWATTTISIGCGNNLEIKRDPFSPFLGFVVLCFYVLYWF